MASSQLKLPKKDVLTVAAIGSYWAWVQALFYSSSLLPALFSPNEVSLWNIGAHTLVLLGLAFAARKAGSYSRKRVLLAAAAILSSVGAALLFGGAGLTIPIVQLLGSVLAGAGSAFLLVGWGELLGEIEGDEHRTNLLLVSILVAVSLFVVASSFPVLLQVCFSVGMPFLCAWTIGSAAAIERGRAAQFGNRKITTTFRKKAKSRWVSLLLCTFLFSIPLVYFRAGETSGVRLSIFSSMLVCLCGLFLVDYYLRKRFDHSVMPHLLVLLTSGGMLLLPFLVGGNVFVVGLLIHTGGFAFRAYIYPEFIKLAGYLGKPVAYCCALGTAALDLGQVAGTVIRGNLNVASEQFFINATIGMVYVLFLAGFLFFTHRFDAETENRTGKMFRKVGEDRLEAEGRIPEDSNTTHLMIEGIERQCALAAEAYGLSAKEYEIMNLMIRGRSRASIADELVVSQNTIKTHMTHIYRKCGVGSREELVRLVESMVEATDEH